MQYDLLDLRLFLHVVSEGSITRGAERLPLSLRRRANGCACCSGTAESPRSYGATEDRPTPAGLAFARHARDVVKALDRLQDGLASYAEPVGEPLTLVAGSSAMSNLVPRALRSLLPVHADCDVITAQRRSLHSVRLRAVASPTPGIRHRTCLEPATQGLHGRCGGLQACAVTNSTSC